MATTKRPIQNWKNGAWGAALAVLFGLVQPPPLPRWLDDRSYDLVAATGADPPPEEAIIIYMDEESHREIPELKQLRAEYEAWDRGVHARLVRRLTEGRAKLIAFDILFEDPSTNDALLVSAVKTAIAANTRVVFGAKVEARPPPASGMRVAAPFEGLEEIAPWGFAEQATEGQVLRRHFPGDEDERGNWVPSLSWRAAELTHTNLSGKPKDLRWIKYYGPAKTIKWQSYHAVLDPNRLPASYFSNKVCFVGALPPETPFSLAAKADLWHTPYSKRGGARMAGVEIVATVYLNLVRGDYLHRMPVWGQFLVVAATGLLFGWGLTLFRPIMAAGIGLAAMAAVAAAAFWLIHSAHVWFSWLIVVVVQIPLAIGWSVLTRSRQLAEEKAALQTQLAAAQTALKQAQTSEAATMLDPSTLAERILSESNASGAPTTVSRPLGDGRPSIPDHDLVRRVGKGAYGEVWLARNVIGTFHAVKIVKREDFESDDPYEREFKGIQKFMPISRSHPGLVQILHAGRNVEYGYIYYIMEAADDETSGQQINPQSYVPKNLSKEIRKRRHLPAEECLQLSLDLTDALEFLHQQHLIHRDIKPANIIFVKGAPKFADIGLVTEIVPTGRETTFLGTFGYIPPEGPGTPAADVYSLGKVLYEAMGQDLQQFPELPSTMLQRPDSRQFFQLNEIVLKATQDDVTKRYRTAREMRDDLQKLHSSVQAAKA